MESLLSILNLSKSFGTLPVIQQVSFDVKPGEVVGLTGSIGSGKSVLVMLLAGLYPPNEGSVIFDQQHLTWPFNPFSLGIGVIHQRPSLADDFDVVSNLFLGNEIGRPARLGDLAILNQKRMHIEAEDILSQVGLQLNSLSEKVSNLSSEQRQMVAIARVLTHQVKMVIIDEPTVLLSYPNQQILLGLIQDWCHRGVSVLFSTSNIDHLFAVTDRIVILHQGRKTADLHTDETTRDAVVSQLLGTADLQKPTSGLWDYDSYDQIREQTERLRSHQILLGKDLAGEHTFSRQLTEQLAEQVQVLDQANLILVEAQRRLLSEREQERKHVARELHDQVIQDLLSINYELEGMESEQDVSPALANDLEEVRQSIRELVDSLRRICGTLRPPTIDSLGLGAALQSHSRDWSVRTGIEVSLDLDPNLGRLPEATELSIFRIVQEGLNNVWRHAHG
jgi:ABC-type multidrug transport system ATPase subunit